MPSKTSTDTFIAELETKKTFDTAWTINEISKCLEQLKKHFHEEDDHNQCCVADAINALEEIKLYTGDGHRL